MTGSQQEGNIWSTNIARTKEQKLGPTAGTTAVLWYLAVLPPGAFVSPGFPVFPSRLPGVLISYGFVCGVAPNPRILRLIYEFSTATACGSCLCCLSLVL